MIATVLLALELTSSSAPPPSNFGLGGIVGILVSYYRRKEDIGGFLFFYYWQLYIGTLGAFVLILLSFQNFVPESYDTSRDYYLYLGSVVPSLIVLAAQVVVGTMLLTARTPEMLKVLRVLIVSQLLLGMCSVVVQSHPPAEPASAGVLLFPAIWAVYFFVSRRVRHVFETNDWYDKVEEYYPSQAKLIT